MDYVFSAEEREELYDFYNFFMEKYDEKTYSARIENWGQEPFIFRLTEVLYDQDREQELLKRKLVKSDEKGHWIPISKKVMEECHCTAPDGSTLEPEENLIYTEISKW